MGKKIKYIKKETITIDKTAKIGKNVTIYPNNFIGENVIIGDNVILYSGNFLENCTIKDDCVIGPYARIRPKTIVKKSCKIGNFVELKNCIIGENTKVSHLTYVGDSVVGKDCNIGCGVVFANYNGKIKQKITVGNNVFVGSNSNLIAPLNISDSVYICAGTTVTNDLDEFDFCIGRSRQWVKKDGAKKYLKNEQMFEKDT